jgi:phage terminase large subunit
VAPIPKEALKVSDDGRTVTLQMKNVEVADQPLWPAFQAAMRPAKLSFRLVLTATKEKITWDVAGRQFRFDGHKAKAHLEASVEVPSLKYAWNSEALEKSTADFAILGKEANGKFYSP